MCYRFPLYTSHPPQLFSSYRVYTYLTFFLFTFFYLTTGPHVWVYICLHFPTLHLFDSSPTPISIHGIIEFELDLYVWDFQPIKPGNDTTVLFIYSLASINFTSVSSTQIPFVDLSSWAIKYLALQQVLISTHFIPTSHNDLLTSEFIAILIATTSSWYFPYPYRYFPF